MERDSGNVARYSDNVARDSDNVARDSDNVARDSDNGPRDSDNVARYSDNVARDSAIHVVMARKACGLKACGLKACGLVFCGAVILLGGLCIWWPPTHLMASAPRGIEPITFPKVILYGDSLTQHSFTQDGHWGALIANNLARKCDVLNRGFGFYNSRWNLIMLRRLFSLEDPRDIIAVTLFLGANDSNHPRMFNHVPVDEFAANMKEMIDQLVEMGITKDKIIIIGVSPVDNEGSVIKRSGRNNTNTGRYAEAVAQVAADTGVHFVELYKSMMKENKWEQFFRDGLHFKSAGTNFLYKKLWPVLDSMTEHLPIIQPDIEDIGDQPEKTLLM